MLEAQKPASESQGSFYSPELIAFAVVCSVGLVGAAIRLTRLSITSRIQSYHSVHERERKLSWRCFWQSFLPKALLQSLTNFWRKVPRRFWNFFIEAFLVPTYRKEWGIYTIWSYQARQRLPKSEEIRREIRIQRRLLHQTDLLLQTKPHPIPHCHNDCCRIRINVAGMRYETQLRTLNRFPDTLLGNSAKRAKYLDPVTEEYYFDRHRHAFEAILYFYQSGGRFRRPEDVPSDVLLEDARFFELSPAVIDQYQIEEGLAPQNTETEEILPKHLLLRKLWLLLEYPESSVQAQFVACLSISAVVISIIEFCIETLDELRLRPNIKIDMTTGELTAMDDNRFEIGDPFSLVEASFNSWFIFEVFLRLCTAPVKAQFFKNVLNIIDLLAVMPILVTVSVPFIVSFFKKGDNNTNESFEALGAAEALYLFRVVRIVRVFRIFRLRKHSKGLQILGKTLRASMNELLLLIFFVCIAVILFSSTMYFAELEEKTGDFDSIPDGFWWALITITTVGYGDDVPKGLMGKIIGSLCAVAGVLTIALPVPVIVSNFNFYYHQAIDEHDLRWININHIASCPYRPVLIKQNNVSSDEEFEVPKKK